MAWSTNAEDAKVLLDVPSPVNIMNDQLDLSSVDICLDYMLQILCKSLLCFANINLEA